MPDLCRVRVTRQALADLEEIHKYISEQSERNAASMMRRILDAIDSLETFPKRTVVDRQVAGLRYPVRSVPVRPYVIYYRVIEEERVVVVRHIRHGARSRSDRIE